jgi:hypothetical protein
MKSGMEVIMPHDVRPSPLAGRWYPGEKSRLRAEIVRHLGTLAKTSYQQIRGLVAPHAGLMFSGPVGAKGFRHLAEQQYDIVVVIGPSHYPVSHPLMTTGHDAYETPLGKIPVAQAILKQLGEKIALHPIRNDPEHSIEMTLPFLQNLLGEFQLVPLVMRDQSYPASRHLAEVLHHILQDKNVLYVASSDLSHFYPQQVANEMDKKVLEKISDYNAEKVTRLQDGGIVYACGYGAISTVMLVTRQQGTKTASQEGYGTSGDVTGDYSSVVGYGSVVFHDVR